MNDQKFYLEDLHVGQRFTSGESSVSAEEIKRFAAEFDPQPFHLDENAAQHTIFGGLVASGWHTGSMAMRLMVGGGVPFAGGLIGLGVEVEWPKPVRPGDTLRVDSEILDIIPSRSKPLQGVVRVRSIMSNQRGEQVFIMISKILVFKRGPV
jgi:acyl dehydratase